MGNARKGEVVVWLPIVFLGLAVTLAGQGLVLFGGGRGRAEAVRQQRKALAIRHALGRAAAPQSAPDPVTVSELLVDSIVQVESGGNSRRVGRAGERGLMQIKRHTWREATSSLFGKPLPFDSAFDPELNRRVGKTYLAFLQDFLKRHRSSWKADERSLLLACYNAGPTRVLDAGFNIRALPLSTRQYVERASAVHDFLLAEHAPVVRQMLLSQLPGRDEAVRGS